ncbi:MAG TPA: UGSC family (seleno)protein, partial [Reyranella sp.]|nr:UGSC family (seleno)protein [Reyranella sp.]
VTAEKEGVPAFGVMTTRFVSAAETMSRVLGMPGYDFSTIEHPVSSATDAELQARARAAIEQGCKLLVQSGT